MKTLAYAIAVGLLALAAPLALPAAAADNCPPLGICPPGRNCNIFTYWLEPQPGWRIDPDCI